MKTLLTLIAGVIALTSLLHGTASAPVRRDPVAHHTEKAKVGLTPGVTTERLEIFIICMYVPVLHL